MCSIPAENQDVKGIPDGDPVQEDAPLFMGFKSGFVKNHATEDRVTIRKGPFAGGTTQHRSKIRLRLQDRYGKQNHEERVSEMFCPFHAEQGKVEGTGESLGDGTDMEGECRDVERAARDHGRVGHSQKMAAEAREDGSLIILRRDFGSTAGDEAGLHFLAVQRTIEDFVRTRETMNGEAHPQNPAIRQRVNNGILEYTFVRRQENYLQSPSRSGPCPNHGS